MVKLEWPNRQSCLLLVGWLNFLSKIMRGCTRSWKTCKIMQDLLEVTQFGGKVHARFAWCCCSCGLYICKSFIWKGIMFLCPIACLLVCITFCATIGEMCRNGWIIDCADNSSSQCIVAVHNLIWCCVYLCICVCQKPFQSLIPNVLEVIRLLLQEDEVSCTATAVMVNAFSFVGFWVYRIRLLKQWSCLMN